MVEGTHWRRCRNPVLCRSAGGEILLSRLQVAVSAGQRMRGLLGRKGLAEGEGLLLAPCNSIHMFFMRFAIDAVFLGRDWRVRKICPDLAPWRMAVCWAAGGVLELPAGDALRLRLQIGERLEVRDEEKDQ